MQIKKNHGIMSSRRNANAIITIWVNGKQIKEAQSVRL